MEATIGEYENRGCFVWIFSDEDKEFAESLEREGIEVTRIYGNDNQELSEVQEVQRRD